MSVFLLMVGMKKLSRSSAQFSEYAVLFTDLQKSNVFSVRSLAFFLFREADDQ